VGESNSLLPVPPEFPLADVHLDPDQVRDSQYLAIITEAERHASIVIPLRFRIPRWAESEINRIVHDARCQYGHSFEAFVTHAVALTLAAYSNLGYPDADLGERVRWFGELRKHADEERQREDIRETLHQGDSELAMMCRDGDWEGIDNRLHWYDDMLRKAPRGSVQNNFSDLIFQSQPIMAAVKILWEYVQSHPDAPPTVRKRANEWHRAYEDLSK